MGASIDGKFIYTIDYQYASFPYRSSCEVYLSTVEIIKGQAYIKDREKIVPAPENENEYYYCGNVVANNEKVYFVFNHTIYESGYGSRQHYAKLVTADLGDPENIRFPSSQNLEVQNADIIKVIEETLFLHTYDNAGGIFTYSLDDPLVPSFEDFYRTDNYPGEIVIINDKAYIPSGMYGTKVIPVKKRK